jgi:hypothetical protein
MKLILLFAVIHLSLSGNAQRVGIGTSVPVAKLDVTGEGSNSNTNVLILKNLIGDTLLRMRNDGRMGIGFNGTYGRTINIGGLGINLYSENVAFAGAVFPTDTSLILYSNSNVNNYVILQPVWGNVGIGTYSPVAKLDVKGSIKLGTTGSILTHIIKDTVARNLPSIAAGASRIETFTLTGAVIGSTAMISPDIELADGLIISYARVSAVNTIEVKFFNASAANINMGAANFFITVIK